MTQVSPPTASDAPGTAGLPARSRNVLGLISLILAVVGTALACLPAYGVVVMSALPWAWGAGMILLPVALILSIVSLFLRGRGKALGLAALAVSVVGAVAFTFVFTGVLRQTFGESFGQSDNSLEAPYPLGAHTGSGDWDVVIDGVTFGATDLVLAESPDNAVPGDGSEYVLVTVTITYLGNDEDGAVPDSFGIEYVSVDGTAVAASSDVIAPDRLDLGATRQDGETATGNLVFEVPSQDAEAGVIAITRGLFSPTIYVASR